MEELICETLNRPRTIPDFLEAGTRQMLSLKYPILGDITDGHSNSSCIYGPVSLILTLRDNLNKGANCKKNGDAGIINTNFP